MGRKGGLKTGSRPSGPKTPGPGGAKHPASSGRLSAAQQPTDSTVNAVLSRGSGCRLLNRQRGRACLRLTPLNPRDGSRGVGSPLLSCGVEGRTLHQLCIVKPWRLCNKYLPRFCANLLTKRGGCTAQHGHGHVSAYLASLTICSPCTSSGAQVPDAQTMCAAHAARQPANALNAEHVLMGRGMWENGWTPGSGIRMLGPYGPRLVSGYARNRYSSQLGCMPVLAFHGSSARPLRELMRFCEPDVSISMTAAA